GPRHELLDGRRHLRDFATVVAEHDGHAVDRHHDASRNRRRIEMDTGNLAGRAAGTAAATGAGTIGGSRKPGVIPGGSRMRRPPGFGGTRAWSRARRSDSA